MQFQGSCRVRIRLMELICEVRRVRPALRPSVAQPALCILRFGFWFRGSARIPWGCCHTRLVERKSFQALCSDALPSGVAARTAVLRAVPATAVSACWSPDAATLPSTRPGADRGPAYSAWTLRPSVPSVSAGLTGLFQLLPGSHSSVFKDPPSLQASLHRSHWPLVVGLADLIPFVGFETGC